MFFLFFMFLFIEGVRLRVGISMRNIYSNDIRCGLVEIVVIIFNLVCFY